MTKPMTINDTTVTTVLNLAVSFMPRMSIHVMPATIAAAGTSSSSIRTAVSPSPPSPSPSPPPMRRRSASGRARNSVAT
jgi:hypothetical protein